MDAKISDIKLNRYLLSKIIFKLQTTKHLSHSYRYAHLFSYYADVEAFPIKLQRENIYNKNCQGIWNSFSYFLDNSNLITIEILEVKEHRE